VARFVVGEKRHFVKLLAVELIQQRLQLALARQHNIPCPAAVCPDAGCHNPDERQKISHDQKHISVELLLVDPQAEEDHGHRSERPSITRTGTLVRRPLVAA
jgi:hypothetical protein